MANKPVNGAGDSYPAGQCTWWASYRYQQLTGYYVPWSGNANQWANHAPAYGWTISDKPVAPSIICLQAGIQQADPTDGHVGVVETVNQDGSVIASNLNWGLTQQERSQQGRQWTFHSGPGVSFIYVAGAGGAPLNQPGQGGALPGLAQKISGAINPNEEVAAYLYALDNALQITNPFDTSQNSVNSVSVLGVTLDDPFSWVGAVTSNMINDVAAFTVRSGFLVLGFIIIIVAIQTVIIQKGNETVGGPEGIMKIAALL